MKKKYLSALLFGALLFASAGTFTSCKDYDDDIDNLQSQITANADAIKALQELVKAGKYVTDVTGDGTTITFTFNDGSTKAVTVEGGEVSQTLTIDPKTGELLNNGEPTGIKPATDPEKAPVKMENGFWMYLNDKGAYESTGIPVSGVTAVKNDKKQWVLTIYDAQGNPQEVVVPSAASVMSDLELMGWAIAGDASKDLSMGNSVATDYKITNTPLNVGYAYVGKIVKGYGDRKETTWSAQKEVVKGQVLTTLAATNTKLVTRVAPADLDMSGLKFTLQDSKGNKLPIALNTAESFTGTLTRTESGISYIPMDVTADTYASAKDYTDLFTENAVYSLVEESGARSTYSEFTFKPTIKTITTPESVTKVDGKAANGGVFEVDLTKANKLTFGDNPELVYDYYVEAVDPAVAKLFNVTIDKKAGTFTVGKLADQITTTTFELYVYALHLDGTIYQSKITIKPSRKMLSEAVLAAGEQVIKQVVDNKGAIVAGYENYMKFEVSLDAMFSSMSDADKEKWTSATLGANTGFTLSGLKIDGKDADLTAGAFIVNLLDANNQVLTLDKSYQAKKAVIYAQYKNTSASPATATLKPGKGYELNINFRNENKEGKVEVLNTAKLTFTPTLPALNAYMVKHASFWEGNTLRGISMAENIPAAVNPAAEVLSYEIVDGFKALGSVKAADKMEITFSLADNKVNNAEFISIAGGKVSYTSGAGKASEQYGKEFTVNVESAKYLDVYTYSEEARKAQSFKMVVLSPVYEGTIEAATALEVEATAGAKLNMADIIAKNYNKQTYTLYQSKVLVGNKVVDVDATNSTANVFDYTPIKSVTVESGDNKVFTVVNAIPTAATWDKEAKKVVPGSVEISTKEISKDTPTIIKVTVEDVWGYKKVVEVPLTIKMAK